ncbi:hypothetical protein S83_008945, partial [Arachis hypogaea]
HYHSPNSNCAVVSYLPSQPQRCQVFSLSSRCCADFPTRRILLFCYHFHSPSSPRFHARCRTPAESCVASLHRCHRPSSSSSKKPQVKGAGTLALSRYHHRLYTAVTANCSNIIT